MYVLTGSINVVDQQMSLIDSYDSSGEHDHVEGHVVLRHELVQSDLGDISLVY